MLTFLDQPGFLGTHAKLYADLTLVLLIFSACLLTLGWRLAVARHFGIHRWVQTSAVGLLSLVVLALMLPSYIFFTLPAIPSRPLQGTALLTTIHAVIGLVTFLLGIFIVLRANGLVPPPLRFTNYKLFMRTSYALYVFTIAMGVIVYLVTYLSPSG